MHPDWTDRSGSASQYPVDDDTAPGFSGTRRNIVIVQAGGDAVKSPARSPERFHSGDYLGLATIVAIHFSTWHLSSLRRVGPRSLPYYACITVSRILMLLICIE